MSYAVTKDDKLLLMPGGTLAVVEDLEDALECCDCTPCECLDDPGFGTYSDSAELVCDHISFVYNCLDMGIPCVDNTDCPPDFPCVEVDTIFNGDTGLSFGLTPQAFDAKGAGSVEVDFEVNVAVCESVVPGSSSRLPESSDTIHAWITISIGANSTAVLLYSTGIADIVTFSPVDEYTFEVRVAAIGGSINGHVKINLPYRSVAGGPDWSAACPYLPGISLSGYVRTEDGFNNPTNVTMSGDVSILARATGDDCDHSITIP